MQTSPVASRLPSLSSRASPVRSRGAGLRRKLMLRLMVTASGTGPIAPSTATYMAKSASAIMVGPEIVPPGRTCSSRNACRTRQPPPHARLERGPAVGFAALGKLGGEKAFELADRHDQRHASPSPPRRSSNPFEVAMPTEPTLEAACSGHAVLDQRLAPV